MSYIDFAAFQACFFITQLAMLWLPCDLKCNMLSNKGCSFTDKLMCSTAWFSNADTSRTNTIKLVRDMLAVLYSVVQ